MGKAIYTASLPTCRPIGLGPEIEEARSPEILDRRRERSFSRPLSRPMAAGRTGRRNLDVGTRSVAGDRCRALRRGRDFPCKIHSN